VLNSQPWRLVLRHDHLELHADRTRWVPGVDPGGRLLVQAVGAALLNARVAIAAQGWAVRVDRLTHQARASQQHDPVVLASVRYWTRRPAGTGEGGSVVPPARTGGAPPRVVVLATHHDDLLARLRSGEAGQRVLLEVATTGGTASPVRPVLELDAPRAQLRTALTWDTWPQSLVQITRGQDSTTGVAARRRRRSDVVSGSTRAGR
jgi:hypothetical protein